MLPCTCGRMDGLGLDVSKPSVYMCNAVALERHKTLVSEGAYGDSRLDDTLEVPKGTCMFNYCHLLPLLVPTVRGTPASVVDRAVMDHGNDSHPTTVSRRRSTSMRSADSLVSTAENL